jgi:PAS domain S-box-containing protein
MSETTITIEEENETIPEKLSRSELLENASYYAKVLGESNDLGSEKNIKKEIEKLKVENKIQLIFKELQKRDICSIVLDSNGFFYKWSKHLNIITKHTDEELRKMGWKDLIHSEERDLMFNSLIKAINNQEKYYNYGVTIYNKDKEKKQYVLHNFLGYDLVSKRPISGCTFLIEKK